MTRPAIGLFSAALIGCQIALMQALALAQWSHFAHMVIAVAMLGFGASGTWLAAWGRPLLRRAGHAVPACMALAALAMTAALPLAMSGLARFDMMELFMGGGRAWRLIVTYLVFFLPFFFGALAIGTAFAADPRHIGALYAWNLAGSALGGPLALLLLEILPAARATALLALVGWGGAVMAGALIRLPRLAAATGLLCLIGAVLVPRVAVSPYKDLPRALTLPEATMTGPVASAHGEVRTVTSPALRYAPALSLTFPGEPPRGEAVFINGHGYGTLLPPSPAGGPHILDATPRGLPYALGTPRSVLILGAGADVGQAQAHGVPRVTAVEPHPVVRRMAAANAAQSDSPSQLRWTGGTPRGFLSRPPHATETGGFDLIVLPAIGEFGGDSGLRAIEENFLLTAEGLARLWQRLSPGGMLGAAAWIDYPPRATLRLAALLAGLLRDEGVLPLNDHLLVARNWGMLAFVLSREPLTAEQRIRAATFCGELGFDLLDLSGPSTAEAPDLFHDSDDPVLMEGLAAIFADDPARALAAYPFDIAPPRDDRPYFQQFLRLREWRAYQRLFLENAAPFLEIGLPLLLLTFGQIALLSLPLVLLPLLRLRRAARGFGRPFVYFVSVGCGFMLWEIVLIQRYTLYWGLPVVAAAGVISVLLLGMGAGSWLSTRFAPARTAARAATGALAALLLVYALLLPPVLGATLGLPGPARGLLGILLLLPPALLMGMPFPLGLRWVEEPTRARIAWAWGLDGYASVISATGAVLLSVLLGFTVPMLLAAVAYGLAAAACWKNSTRP